MGPLPDADETNERLKKLDLSKDEVGKFEKAFKDPEFIKLFADYVNEIKDPSVKAETDAYLRQIEMEGRVEEVYGKGVQLISPEEALVFKTVDTRSKRKAFINVCTSDKVAALTMRSEEGRRGMHVELPFHTGPAKKGVNKDGSECGVWDVVVHVDTLKMVVSRQPVRDMLAEMAMDKIESVSPDVKLDRNYKMPKMKYKASEGVTKPPVLALRAPGGGGESVGGRVKPQQAADPAVVDAAAAGARDAAAAAGATAATAGPAGSGGGNSRSKFSFGSGKGAQAPDVKPALKPHQAGYRHESGETTPVWEVIHRGEVDMAAAWGDAGRGLTLNTTHPKELVLRFHLPGLASAAECDVDVERQSVSLLVAGRYRLADAPLPFAVESASGRAKFHRATQRLEVTLPVVPPPPPPQWQAAAAQAPSLVEDISDSAEPTTDTSVAPQHEGATAAAAPHPPQPSSPTSTQAAAAAAAVTVEAAASAAKVEATGDATTAQPSEVNEAVISSDGNSSEEPHNGDRPASPAEGNTAGTAPPEPEMTENERRWQELHAKQQLQQQAADVASGDGRRATADAAGCSGGQVEASVEAAAAGDGTGPACAPVAPPAPTTVQLKPRLKSTLAEELD